MRSFQQIGTDTGALVERKNRAYGSSITTVGAAMRLLYPRGIAPEQMDDMGLLTRIWDKMMRIATDRDALGENPYADIAGYGILGVHMHEATEQGMKEPCGIASTVAHLSASRGPHAGAGSAAIDVNGPTTRSAKRTRGQSSARRSNKRSVSASARKAVLARTATVPVRAVDAAGHANRSTARKRNGVAR